jgi:hypothetical protein
MMPLDDYDLYRIICFMIIFLTQLFLHGLKGAKINYYIITEPKKENYKEIILKIFVLEISSNT